MSDSDDDTIRDARSPFDDSNADIIFRSSDNTDFRVHTSIMSLASPFFHDMFTLPATKASSPTRSASNPPQIYKDGLRVVPFLDAYSEAHTVRLFLLSCYAIHVEASRGSDEQGFPLAPDFTLDKPVARETAVLRPLVQSHNSLRKELRSKPLSLEDLKLLSIMFDLYQVSDISITLLRACIEAAREDPAVAYAQACRFQNAPLKDAACRLMLERSLFPLSTSPDLACMTGVQMVKLVQYRQDAGTVAAKLGLDDLQWLKDADIPKSCMACQSSKDDCTLLDAMWPYFTRTVSGPKWLFDFLEKSAGAIENVPKGWTVKEQARLDSALDAANSCKDQVCRKGAVQALRKISDELAMAIDEAVANVCSALNQSTCGWRHYTDTLSCPCPRQIEIPI